MNKATDVHVTAAAVYLLPIQSRVPIKFGREVVTGVTCARFRLTVRDRQGNSAEGWGETPLSVQWAWPGPLSYEVRLEAMTALCIRIAEALVDAEQLGHPIEIGYAFQEETLPGLRAASREGNTEAEGMPELAALLCWSAADIALHDAYGNLHGVPAYSTYNARYMSRDLATFVEPAADTEISFAGKYPNDFLRPSGLDRVCAWHLVAGLDPLEESDLTGHEPRDEDPVLLTDWIARDGLQCLKIKLSGDDADWDFDRIQRVGNIAITQHVNWLSVDFNCTAPDPAYVNLILDRLRDELPRVFGMILYVEQPFPYELRRDRFDVHSVAARKPLFMDESAHDWRVVRFGRELGWNGVALKTCKSQSGALLSMCWAEAHGMGLMVQDLANPMLAMIPHALLAAHSHSMMGCETNSSQFYPRASAAEARIHPGIYRRKRGFIDLSTLSGPGFGYRLDEIKRQLPSPAAVFEQ